MKPSAATTVHPRRDRSRELVEIAYRLIAERGLEGLRFADVARQAGINNGTLLYYFPSKEALIQGVVAYLIAEYAASRVESPPVAADDPLQQLRREFDDVRVRLRHHPEQSVVYAELLIRGQRDPAVATLLERLERGWHRSLTDLLDRGRTAGIFRADLDPVADATTVMTVLKGIAMQAMSTPDMTTLDRLVSDLASLVERGLVADSSGGSRGISQ